LQKRKEKTGHNLGKHWKVRDSSKMREARKKLMKKPEVRQKIREWQLNHPNKKYSGTKIELKMREELDRRGFVKNRDYFCNICLDKIANVDIYLPAYKIVIECDGCRYHYCKQCKVSSEYFRNRPADDIRKNEALRNAGYFVYRFWEHEINKSTKECVNTLDLTTSLL